MNELVAGSGSSGVEPSAVGQRLRVFLDAERVVDDLRRYFGIGLPPGVGAFTGDRFEHLAGGGDRRQVADRFTAEDLVAVQTLSVTVPPRVRPRPAGRPAGYPTVRTAARHPFRH